jgi:hypothetical protein
MAGPYMPVPQLEKGDRSQNVLTWFLTILACTYIAWTGVNLYRSAAAFGAMFVSMNLQLPTPTGFVVNNYQWFCPGLFGGALALVVAKQFFIRNKWQNITVTCAATIFVMIVGSAMVQALYRPVFDMIEKLNR